jgi:hypothetical protein
VAWASTPSSISLAAQHLRESQAFKAENEQLKAERSRYCERVVLLEEELRWLKARARLSVEHLGA